MHKYLFLTAFIVASNIAQAQESVNSIGGVDVGTGGTVSFSVAPSTRNGLDRTNHTSLN